MVHVYTGNGKGKTTAALGLSARAACAGIRVLIGQFLKGTETSELCLPLRFPGLIEIEQYGTGDFVGRGGPSEEDGRKAMEGLGRIRASILSGGFGMVVADEICVAVSLGLITEAEVVGLARGCPRSVELVLTGRGATPAIIEAADLVTEMVEVKHYFSDGEMPARKGIEY